MTLTPTKSSSGNRPSVRFTLRGMIVTISFLALGLALLLQDQRLQETKRALARYETSQVPTAIPEGQFRVILRTVLDNDEVKLLSYRIESADEHFATIRDSDGGGNGARSEFDAKTNLYVTEATVLFDHLDSRNCVKMMPRVGGAQGYTIMPVPEDYTLNSDLMIEKTSGLHARSSKVRLFTWNGKEAYLSLK